MAQYRITVDSEDLQKLFRKLSGFRVRQAAQIDSRSSTQSAGDGTSISQNRMKELRSAKGIAIVLTLAN